MGGKDAEGFVGNVRAGWEARYKKPYRKGTRERGKKIAAAVDEMGALPPHGTASESWASFWQMGDTQRGKCRWIRCGLHGECT